MGSSLFSGLRNGLRYPETPPAADLSGPVNDSPLADGLAHWTLFDWAPLLAETASYGRLAKLSGQDAHTVTAWFRERLLNPVEERDRLLRLLKEGHDVAAFAVSEADIDHAVTHHDNAAAAAAAVGMNVEELSSWLAKRGRTFAAEFRSSS